MKQRGTAPDTWWSHKVEGDARFPKGWCSGDLPKAHGPQNVSTPNGAQSKAMTDILLKISSLDTNIKVIRENQFEYHKEIMDRLDKMASFMRKNVGNAYDDEI